MAAAYKAGSATTNGANDAGANTIASASVTVAADDVFYLDVISSDSVPLSCTGVVWDAAGVNEALTLVGADTTYATNYRSSAWRGKGLTAKTAVFTATFSGNQTERLAVTTAFTGLDQTTPNGTVVVNSAAGTGPLTTGAMATTVGQLVCALGAIGTSGTQSTFDSPTGTERVEGSIPGTPYDSGAAQDYAAVTTSTTMTWTSGGGAPTGWSMYGIPLNDAAAAASVSTPPDNNRHRNMSTLLTM